MKAIVGVAIAATLLLGSGCAKKDWIDRTLVTVDVTGTSHGRIGAQGTSGVPPDILLELEQKGSTVTGAMRFAAGGSSTSVAVASRITEGTLDGTVAGDVFRFRLTNGSLEGELTVSDDTMTGQSSWGQNPIFLRRVDPSSPPASPPR